MCLSNSPDPGTFSGLPGVKSVLAGEFLLICPKIFGGPLGVLQRGVYFNVVWIFSFVGWGKREAKFISNLLSFPTGLPFTGSIHVCVN